ncbi:MAG: hypothetical protein AMXMBFR53_27200 [Gemmatimonadota bacterium]
MSHPRRMLLLAAAVTWVACGGDEGGDQGVPVPPLRDDPPVFPAVPAEEGPAPRTGMMTYLADAARFTDCATAAAYPIAQEGGYAALERAYLAARPAPGEPVLVTVQAAVAAREGMEGGLIPTLLVDSLLEVHPDRGCGGERPDAPLERTEWVLAEVVGGVPVPPGVEATLVLDPERSAAAGSTGCNRFDGSYRLDGGRLTFGMSAATRMACPETSMALEVDYLEALRLAGSYRLLGPTLELLGAGGPVARFRAR